MADARKRWLEKDRESDFSRRNGIHAGDSPEVREMKTRPKSNTVAQVIGIGLGLGAGIAWLTRIGARYQADELERSEFTRKQNEIWRSYEEKATARGGGAFDNMRKTADGFWEESPHKRAAGASSAPPLDRSQMNSWQQSRFDAAQDIRQGLATEAEWRADPKGMAEAARSRAEGTGQPLDPRAARYFAERGLPAPERLSGAGAVEAGPGVDLEGMKRVKTTPEPVAGGSRAGSWAGRAGAAAGLLGVGLELWSFGRDVARQGFSKTWSERHPMRDSDGLWPQTPDAVRQFVRANSRQPKASGPSFASEEEARAFYGDGGGDDRAPVPGGVPSGFTPGAGSDSGGIAGGRGWSDGDGSARKKKGKPFADPYGIGQARLQAENDIDGQRAVTQREETRQRGYERKAQSYIDYIEREDRKNERARLASERREIDAENDSNWLAQLSAWEQKRLEGGGRRRHRSITVNAWQAAGATVGGFAQINVEMVRGEIERSLERGDTAIRMN